MYTQSKIGARVLLFGSLLAILALFLVQAEFSLRGIPRLRFRAPELLYGYTNTNFTLAGTVYTNRGLSAIGALKTVAVSRHGTEGVLGSADTDSAGAYSITGLTISGGTVLTLYLNDETEDGVLVLTIGNEDLLDKTTYAGLNIYANRLIVRASSGSQTITNAHLRTANVSDGDVRSIYRSESDNQLNVQNGRELFVWSGSTFVPGAKIRTHDFFAGSGSTVTMSTNSLVVTGSLITSSGSFTTSTGVLLTSTTATEALRVRSNSLLDLTIDNGLLAYWNFDAGTGSAVRDVSRSRYDGTMSGHALTGTGWTALTNTGTMTAWNPYALTFDGSNDLVRIGNVLDHVDQRDFTITGWFRRDSSDTHDVILAKRTGTGASSAGYVLYIGADDLLHFAVSDGTDTYVLDSVTTFTTPNWRHFAIVWDDDSAASTEIYIGGSADSATDTGTLGNVGSLATSAELRIGAFSGYPLEPFDGLLEDLRVYNRKLSTDELLTLAGGARSTGSGRYVMQSALDVNGNLGIYAGELDVSPRNHSVTVGSGFVNHGRFLAQSGTVTLDGRNQTLSGATQFRNLSKVLTAAAASLTLDHTASFSFSGSLTLRGVSASTQLTLNTAGSGEYVNMILEGSGAQSIQYVNVRDNWAQTRTGSGQTLRCQAGCTDSGNNRNWTFSCGNGDREQGEQCDDSNTTSGDGCSSSCTIESGYTCTSEPSSCSTSCGDGVKAGSEQCDNGGSNSNTVANACRTSCTNAGCGDSVVDTGESCDDGNSANTDACLSTCAAASCGDGHVRTGVEECEPPNTGACASNCLARTGGGGGGGGGGGSSASSTTSYSRRDPPPVGCGNNILQTELGEQCDRGRFNGFGPCDFNCKELFCGDGVVTPHTGEQCEPTEGPLPTCGSYCTRPEENASGKSIGGCKHYFLKSCPAEGSQPPADEQAVCGNGSVETGEECDSGGLCSGGAFDGTFWTDAASGRTCTDGGGVMVPVSGDGCSDACKREFCGDSVLQDRGADGEPGTEDDEECDNGSICSDRPEVACRLSLDCPNATCVYDTARDRTCSETCKRRSVPPELDGLHPAAEEVEEEDVTEEEELPATRCGNGVVENDEECDDGDANADTAPDACRTDCTFPTCGDGIVDSDEECDDAEGNSNQFPDRCRRDCRLPRCGDGVRDSGEQCDSTIGCTKGCRNAVALQTQPRVVQKTVSQTSSTTVSRQSSSKSSAALVAAAVTTPVSSTPSSRSSSKPSVVTLSPVEGPYPLQTTPYALLGWPYGFFPLDALQYAAAPQRQIAGQTGPAALIIVMGGAAAGVTWMRRRKQ